MSWHLRNKAQSLLSDMRDNPPAKVVRPYRVGRNIEPMSLFDPQDPRMRELKALWMAAEPEDHRSAEWKAWVSLDHVDALRHELARKDLAA